jgi:hypothetical protein
MDKFAVDFKGIPQGVFYQFQMQLRLKYGTRPLIYIGRFVYEMKVDLGEGRYMFIGYRNKRETEGTAFTLRLESHPEYYLYFLDELRMLREAAEAVVFAGGDVAYDVCEPLDQVIVMANHIRRKMRMKETTRYFGKPHQRKQDGYCRVYDKRLELLQQQGINIDHDLTRIEMVYKPRKITLAELRHYPPKHNKQYTAIVADDWAVFSTKERERLEDLQYGQKLYSRHIRESIKKTLADRTIDFDRLASEQWETMIAKPCAAILAA